jgi:hypothetical protein
LTSNLGFTEGNTWIINGYVLIVDGIMEYELDYDLTLTVLDLLMIFGCFSQMM